MSISGIAMGGIANATARFERTAARVARAGTNLAAPDDNLANDMIDQMSERTEVAVNVKVARTADEMVGTILDIVA